MKNKNKQSGDQLNGGSPAGKLQPGGMAAATPLKHAAKPAQNGSAKGGAKKQNPNENHNNKANKKERFPAKNKNNFFGESGYEDEKNNCRSGCGSDFGVYVFIFCVCRRKRNNVNKRCDICYFNRDNIVGRASRRGELGRWQ